MLLCDKMAQLFFPQPHCITPTSYNSIAIFIIFSCPSECLRMIEVRCCFCCIRDDIMALKGEKEKILELICGLPQQMEARDVNDFCSIAVLYSAQTPVSYKRVCISLTIIIHGRQVL